MIGAEKSRLIDSIAGSVMLSKAIACSASVSRMTCAGASSAPLSRPISAVLSGITIGCLVDWPGVAGTDCDKCSTVLPPS